MSTGVRAGGGAGSACVACAAIVAGAATGICRVSFISKTAGGYALLLLLAPAPWPPVDRAGEEGRSRRSRY